MSEAEYLAFQEAVNAAKAALDSFDWLAGETNITLEDQLKIIKDEAKWWQIISVIRNESLDGAVKLNAAASADVEIQRTLHPLREQQLRLENEIKSLNTQSQAIIAKGGEVSLGMITKQMELKLKEKKLDQTIAVARLKNNAAFIGSLGDVAGEMKGGAKTAARLAQVAAMIDAYAGYNKMIGQGGLFAIGPATMALATGLANVLKISNSIGDFGSAQFGMDQVVSKPTLILTGEQNKRERVQVTPLQSPNLAGPSSGGVVVNINAPLVDETVRDSIMPSIQKALRSNAA